MSWVELASVLRAIAYFRYGKKKRGGEVSAIYLA